MKRTRIPALLLALSLLLGLLAGCQQDPAPTAAPTEPPVTTQAPVTTTQAPEPDWAELYAQALARLEAAPDLTLTLEVTEERTVGGDTLTETGKRTLQFQGRDTDKPVIHTSDLIVSGIKRAAYEQTWADGKAYAKVKEARYYARESMEDFLAAQLPVVLLRPENYGSLTGREGLLTFSEPLAGEAWAMPQDGVLVDAAASAQLTEGELTALDYELTYRFGGSTIHGVYHAELQAAVEEDLSALVPANTKEYESLNSVEAAIAIFRARRALENATVATIQIYGQAYAEAAGVLVAYTEEEHNYGTGADFQYRQEDNVTAVHLGEGTTEQVRFEALMKDGVYTTKWDDEEPEEEDLREGIAEADLEERLAEIGDECLETQRGILLNLFPNYNELVDAQMYDVGDYLLVEFTPTEDYSLQARQELNLRLFNSYSTLDDYSTSHKLRSIEGYLALEKCTYLPTSLYLEYAGVYTIYGQNTNAALAYNKAYRLYDPDTYEAINEEPLPDQEPETRPTPLFYKVTGPEGRELYLLGTIHIGDDRTAYLPQPIYDALEAADALAVEFDTDAFTETLQEDEELQARVRESYVYTDGTTIASHLDSELYEAAVYLMKTAGEYTALAEQYRPFVWSQILDNFYLAQGRQLTSSKGVDNRLMALAREAEKEILNVESGEFQLSMLAGYSDRVQEMLLAQTVSTTRNETLAAAEELYELWCQGDEAKLRARMAAMTEEERAEVDPDDLAIYDEYHQAMEVERNAHMLEVAQGYLEGDQTVFFAVGLAHLLGEGGLVDALRAAGYEVTLLSGTGE